MRWSFAGFLVPLLALAVGCDSADPAPTPAQGSAAPSAERSTGAAPAREETAETRRSSAEEEKPLVVEVFGPTSIPGQAFQVPHGERWECIVPLLAQTKGGRKGDFAEWKTVSVKFYNLATGEFTGGSTAAERDVELGWGSGRIYKGQTQNHVAPFSHDFPFRVDFVFNYVPHEGGTVLDAGAPRTATYSVRCEPPGSSAADGAERA